MMNDKRCLALTEYAGEGARTQPPVFVGRDAVIKDIEFTARLSYEKWRSDGVDANDPGLTRLVQGAPGAGKTALLRHMQGLWTNDVGKPGRPIGLRIGVNDLSDAQALREAVENALPRGLTRELGAMVVRAILKLVPGFVEGVSPVAGTAARTVIDMVSKALGRARRPVKFPGPVVLMVDEAQRIAPHSKPAQAAQNLHDGHIGDIPILPVFAGLGYLQNHLQRKGINISRYSDPRRCIHTLESLSEAECRTLLEGWLRHFEVDAPDALAERWADVLLLDSQGWAMHTNGFLRALAEALVASDNPASLASVDLDAVRRAAAEDRAVYYSARYDGVLLDNRQWVGRAMIALDAAAPVWPERAIQIIGEAGQANEQVLKEMCDALVERGFLHLRRPNDLYACPIPSLVRYAAVKGMEDPFLHTAATLGNIDDLRRLVAAGADLDGRDALGRTPLHIAAECQWADVAQVLLDAGADADAPDAEGTTARDAWPEFGWPD